MDAKRPTRDEAHERMQQIAMRYGHRFETKSFVDAVLDFADELIGGFAEPPVEMTEVEPSGIHCCRTDLSLTQEEVLCARSNAWEKIKDRVHEIVDASCSPSGSMLTAANLAIALRDLLTGPEFGVGPNLKS